MSSDKFYRTIYQEWDVDKIRKEIDIWQKQADERAAYGDDASRDTRFLALRRVRWLRLRIEELEPMPDAERTAVMMFINDPLLSNEDIASQLGKSVRTIENQMSRAYKRFNITGTDFQKKITLYITFNKEK